MRRQGSIDEQASVLGQLTRKRGAGAAGNAVDRPRDAIAAGGLLQLLGPAFVRGAQHDVTAEFTDLGDLLFTAYQVDGAESLRFRDLQHEATDRRAGRALDKPVAASKLVLHHCHCPCRHRVDQGLCGVLVGDRRRYSYRAVGRTDDLLSPGPGHIQQNDALSDPRARHVAAHGVDDSDALGPGRSGQFWPTLRGETSTDDVQVGRVHGRQEHPHADFRWPRHGFGQITQVDYCRRFAVVFDDQGLHVLSPSLE